MLGGLKGRGLPEGTVIALEGVGGSNFLLFIGEGRSAEGPTLSDLAEASDAVARRLRSQDFVESSIGGGIIDFNVGYALVSATSVARFERRLAQGIREAQAMTLRASDRLQRERADELRNVLRTRSLRTYYQPIVDMEHDDIVGYEALTRGPANTFLEVPDALFSCSDSARLSGELDALCRTQAVRNARGFASSLKLFVNVLPEAFTTPSLAENGLEELLAEMTLEPRNLVLEITERCAIENFERFCEELAEVRRRGFLVAIDDVGTGYSSLQSISEVQPDFLKIDISLIKNVHQSLIKQHLVESLLQVGSRIGARVIAEGIELEAEYRALRACGVRYGQGYYFARPAPPFPTLARRGTGRA
jgi:EAL domain-containing protein (putative c-di-GMP-specific phosphodiesterase class I)